MSELTLVENQVRKVKVAVYVTTLYQIETEVSKDASDAVAERLIRADICCGDTLLEDKDKIGISSVSVEVLFPSPTQGEQGAEEGGL